ncbi:cation-transporting P-type ATPase [Methylocaldum sp.]|uniref:cation-transporting P-type ATPase n=1 Tax=Methylocaldum sp. TaxID=1969727 RepID=UPI002D285F92|nr:cation-transporting P-type ATPase [Methylocaldum sp.]HYE37097.1 cation-transporting P-type ATPase [Methylocaldum sp.]
MSDTTSDSPEKASEATAWHCIPVEQSIERLETDRRNGLPEAEARERLTRFGPNRLPPARKRSALLRFLSQFNNLLIYVLLAAASVTFLLEDYVDTAVIVAVVVLNAFIGFIQEGKAEAAIEAVRNLLSPSAAVLRGGRRMTVPAEQLVPGDLVLLQSGDKVPADLRLIEVRSLRIDEAVLTGESVPVEKFVAPVAPDAPVGDRLCMAHSGTLVTYGQGLGVVAATGTGTEIGRISTMLAEVGALATPLLRKIEQFARWLTAIILAAAAATFAFGWLTRRLGLEEMFMAAVSLAVAAIPEGLPAIVTITLAVGVQRMAQRSAILRKLPAVETLGSVTVICSDKTGTLTRNEMTVQTVATAEDEIRVGGAGYSPQGGFSRGDAEAFAADLPHLLELARASLLCNDATLREEDGVWRLEGDPTEGALVTLALKAGLKPEFEQEALRRIDAIPFESEHRFMATLHRDHSGHGLIYLKGAPEVVLERCNRQRCGGQDEPLDPTLWHRRITEIAARGQRLLALAVRPLTDPPEALTFADTEGGFTLLGVAGMIDPPRPEAVDAVARCQSAGIRVKMITGDHAATACAVGTQLGISDGARALTGAEIEDLDDGALRSEARDVEVFARASPEHKLRLVKALREDGHVVSMTGDGVNDAPALKAADIGVAMGQRGTEAAKEAAEMVLADDNFATIATAVEEGRTVYDNLRKTILFTMPTNGGEGGVIIAAILLGQELPITPLQILWVNLVTAVTLALTLAFEPPEGDLMQRPPRPPREPLVTRYMLWRIAYVSLLLVGTTLGLYKWEIGQGAAVEMARTAAVNALVAGELVYLINSRFFVAPSLSLRAWFGNRYAVLAIIVLIGLQLLFTYASFMQNAFGARDLSGEAWLRIAGAALLVFLAVELEKTVVRRLGRPVLGKPTRPVAPEIRPARLLDRAAAVLAGVLGLILMWQLLEVSGRLYTLVASTELDVGPMTAVGVALAVFAVLCALVLIIEALLGIKVNGGSGTVLKLLIPALLLAIAWHAPSYPFEPWHLPWLLAASTTLLVLGIVYLVLLLIVHRTSPPNTF